MAEIIRFIADLFSGLKKAWYGLLYRFAVWRLKRRYQAQQRAIGKALLPVIAKALQSFTETWKTGQGADDDLPGSWRAG